MLEGEAFQLWSSQYRVQLLAQRGTARTSVGIEVADRLACVDKYDWRLAISASSRAQPLQGSSFGLTSPLVLPAHALVLRPG